MIDDDRITLTDSTRAAMERIATAPATAARAPLAAAPDGPAVPEGREPASVAGQPSDEELLKLWHGSDWYNEGATLREFRSISRAVLARWGNPAPTPPADGEVAERAAELLQRHPDA